MIEQLLLQILLFNHDQLCGLHGSPVGGKLGVHFTAHSHQEIFARVRSQGRMHLVVEDREPPLQVLEIRPTGRVQQSRSAFERFLNAAENGHELPRLSDRGDGSGHLRGVRGEVTA